MSSSMFKSDAYQDYLQENGENELWENNIAFGYHPETEDDLFVSNVDRQSGTYVVGVQGSGKSGLIQNLIGHDISNDQAVIVLDPHGDLIDDCIARLPEE